MQKMISKKSFSSSLTIHAVFGKAKKKSEKTLSYQACNNQSKKELFGVRTKQ